MEVYFDGRTLLSRADFFHRVDQITGVPDWFGHNLDALYDLLVAVLPKPVTLYWSHAEVSAQAMGPDFDRLTGVLKDAQNDRLSKFKVHLIQGPHDTSGNETMGETMQALAKTQPAEGLELITAPIPEMGPEDVLIKVRRTAVLLRYAAHH